MKHYFDSLSKETKVANSVATLRCNVKLPILTFECNVSGGFATLGKENSRVITVLVWVWVNVWGLSCLFAGVCLPVHTAPLLNACTCVRVRVLYSQNAHAHGHTATRPKALQRTQTSNIYYSRRSCVVWLNSTSEYPFGVHMYLHFIYHLQHFNWK